MLKARALAALTSLVLAGCPAKIYALHTGELPPSDATVPAETRNAVWQHAVVVLIEQGYVPQLLNEAAGYISSRRRDDLTDDALAGTTALVTVSADGAVRVVLAGMGAFHSEDEFVRAMGERQALLARLISAPPGTPPLAPPRAP